ncbi:MAG: AMP nucleosidase [Bdellovibrionales bacterium]
MTQPQEFRSGKDAVEFARRILDLETKRIVEGYQGFINGDAPKKPVRGYYPEFSFDVERLTKPKDKARPLGYFRYKGRNATTVSRLDSRGDYWTEQLQGLIDNNDLPVKVGLSETPIPLPYALNEIYDLRKNVEIAGTVSDERANDIAALFDLPEAEDHISEMLPGSDDVPLSMYNGAMTDRSYGRIIHYTGTHPNFFQRHVLFTNYQDYIDEFRAHAKEMVSPEGQSLQDPYLAFVEPGNNVTTALDCQGHFDYVKGQTLGRAPQMPAYHLIREDGSGVSIVNIGVGPSNAKTMTDELAFLRSDAWMMVGHCAGLDNHMDIGDYIIPKGYVLRDGIMDRMMDTNIDVPDISEINGALIRSVKKVLGVDGDDFKRVCRQGVITTIADRNWETPATRAELEELTARFRRNNSAGLEMETGTIATNGFRHKVPYGGILCVSDKPMHGVPKMPGVANTFYRERVKQQFKIAMEAIEELRLAGKDPNSRQMRSGFDWSPVL